MVIFLVLTLFGQIKTGILEYVSEKRTPICNTNFVFLTFLNIRWYENY